MFDVMMPSYTKSLFDGYVLIRFMRCRQHQKDFLDGKIFFNTSDFFARCESSGVGDHNEGAEVIAQPTNEKLVTGEIKMIGGKAFIAFVDYSNEPEKYPGLQVYSYSPGINRRRKILCLYSMFINIGNNEIAPFSLNMPSEFGEYGVIITDRVKFFDRIGRAMQKEVGLGDGMMGFVRYKPQAEMQGIVDWQPFYKRKKFSYQNEFRFTFVNKNEDACILNLDRDLSDIAVPIQTGRFVSEVNIKNGVLHFPIYEEPNK